MVNLDFLDLPHPTNRIWPGSPTYVLMSVEEAGIDGYLVGATWPAEWKHVPGGPWVSSGKKNDGFEALWRHEARVRRTWLEAWHKGFVEIHKDALPSWYRPGRNG